MPEVPGGAAADAVFAVAFLLFFLSVVAAAAVAADVEGFGDLMVARAQDGSGDPATAAAEVAAVTQLDLPFGWRAQNRPDDALGRLGKLAARVSVAARRPATTPTRADARSRAVDRGAGPRIRSREWVSWIA